MRERIMLAVAGALGLAGCWNTPPEPVAAVVGGGIVVAAERWGLDGFAVGLRAGNHDAVEGGMGGPDAIVLDDGSVRLYYSQAADAPIGTNILVADSADGVKFSPRKTPALVGSLDDGARTRYIGGPSVVRLPDGGWRMFTRCAATAGGESHVRSAISVDGGLTFSDEGVVLENRAGDPASPWQSVGHGRVYPLDDGTWAGVFTVYAAGSATPDLALFTSPDARAFSFARTLYVGWHDPVVVPRGDDYLMVAQYLDKYVALMVSLDGVHWYPEVSKLELGDPRGLRATGSAPGMVTSDYQPGEFAAVFTGGKLTLFSSFAGDGGLSSVARYQPDKPSTN